MRDLNQELAVNFEHRDIIVAAGAGTGKTESMTNRVVRNVLNGASIKHILVLTFTNRAAAEMKGRIESKLRKAAYEEKNPEVKSRLLEETRLVDRAHIQTFHSFCVDLIREYHHFLDISPDFYVLSDAERSLLLLDAFEDVFQSVSRDPSQCPSAYDWYYQADRAGKPNHLREYVLKLFEIAEASPDFEEKLHKLNSYSAEKAEQLKHLNEEMIPGYIRNAERKLERYGKFVEESPIEGQSGLMAEGYHLIDYDKKGKVKKILSPRGVSSENLDMAKSRLSAILSGGDKEYRRKALRGIPENLFGFHIILGKTVQSSDEYKALAKKLHEEVTEALDRLKERKSFGEIGHRTLFERYFDDLAKFSLLFKHRFDRMKADRNAIDFVDQEHMALSLLADEAVRNSVRSRFSYVFVDENQDSSDIQDKIIRFVAAGSLYRVGDVKQCIYAFRNAEPKIFQNYIETDSVYYDAYAARKPTGEELAEAKRVVIPLNTNFRTVQPILDFVNLIFRNEMPHLYRGAELISFRTLENAAAEESSAIAAVSASAEDSSTAAAAEKSSAEDSAWESVGQSQGGSPAGDISEGASGEGFPGISEDSRGKRRVNMDSPVRILRYRRSTDEAEERSEAVNPNVSGEIDRRELSNIEMEAEVTAREIRRFVLKKRCKYRDCAVLLRSLSGRGNAFRRAFRRYGIPLEVQSEGNMLDFYEIATLTSSIRAILNPYRDTSFVALLLSPFFEFTMKDLRRLSEIRTGASTYFALFAAIFRTRRDWDLPDELIAKIVHTYEQVNRLRGYSHYLKPGEFIWKLCDFNSFFDRIGNLPDGAGRQANLKIYINTVIEDGGSLEEIVRREEMKIPNDISEESDAVKLMTMHSSKGMGFPHVFICNVDGRINEADARGRIIKADFGMAIEYLKDGRENFFENGVYALAQERIKSLNLEEEKRILYVAMTRAKETLTILTSREKSDSSDRNSHFDMILPYAGDYMLSYDIEDIENLPEHPENIVLPETADSSDNADSFEAAGLLEDSESPENRDVVSPEAAVSFETSGAPVLEVEYEPYFAYETLSGAKPPKFAGRVHALEMGSEAHKQLELFDFKKLLDMTDEEVQVAKFSDRKVVDRFIKSPFARRIAEADEVYKEAEFVDDIGSGKQQGIIDLFFIEKGKIVLVDYKTDVYHSGEEAAIVSRYKSQLERYKKVLERVYERRVDEVYLYLLHGEGKLQPIDFD